MPSCVCLPRPLTSMKGLKKVYKSRSSASSPRIGSHGSLVTVAVEKQAFAQLESTYGASPSHRGVLLKYTNAFKGWKRRIFVLENGVLVYGSAGDEDERGPSISESTADGSMATTTGPNTSATPSVTGRPSDRNDAMSSTFTNANGGGTGANDSTDGRRISMNKKARSKIRARRRLLRRHGSKEKEDRDIKGRINLQFAVITPDDSDSCRFAIDVGYDVYHCKAESEQERDNWVRILNESNAYFKGLISNAAARANARPHSPVPTQDPLVQIGKSEDSDDSVLEDDGLREAEESRKALMGELRHVIETWRSTWLSSNGGIQLRTEAELVKSIMHAFCNDSDKGSGATGARGAATPRCADRETCVRDTAKSLLDLTTWCLQVLTTNDEMYDRRLKADLARMMGRAVPVFPPGSATNDADGFGRIYREGEFDEESEADLEFFDALSRSASINSARFRMPGGVESRHRLQSTDILDVPEDVDDDSAAAGTTNTTNVPKSKDTESSSSSRSRAVSTNEPADNSGSTATNAETVAAEQGATVAAPIRRVRTNMLGPETSQAVARISLPKVGPREKLNIWSIIKDSIGKDLSKISIPVVLNEPLSFVQRLAEDVEYSELFDKASECPDQYERMMWVTAGIISHYSSTLGRVNKPFNPLLGETFELVRPNKGKGLRFVSEQVSHHPPISACYAEGSGAAWKYYNGIEIRNKFWGKSLELFPVGLCFIEIPKYGDKFVFEQPTTCVHNIVVGRLWIDNYGDVEIVNRNTGDKCMLTFNKTGWMSDSRSFASIKASIRDRQGKEQIKLGGNWTERVYRDRGKGKHDTLWTVSERPSAEASNGYNWTKWAITLNEPVPENLYNHIAPTDSRFRPDQRALENGNNDEANALKTKLEQGQRDRRQNREIQGEKWSPLWFDKSIDDVTGKSFYKFNESYFNHKSNTDWSICPDLFSCANHNHQSLLAKRPNSETNGS